MEGSGSFDEVTDEIDAVECVVVEMTEVGGEVFFERDEPSSDASVTGARDDACRENSGVVMDAAAEIGLVDDDTRADLFDWAETAATEQGGDDDEVDFERLEEEFVALMAGADWYPSACAAAFDADGQRRVPPGGVEMTFTLVGWAGEEYDYDIVSGCDGLGGFGDVREGMIMNMTDQFGDVTSIASLDTSTETSLGCELSGEFSITYAELDPDATYLIGDRQGRRGELAFTGEELIENEGVELSLG